MSTVLALDTSTDWASLALVRGQNVVWEKEIPSQRSHSAALFPALVEASSVVDGRIDRIAVGLGPGSFAGIRIAIAAAMGLEAVWGCELVGLPSVLALAPRSFSYRVLGDARRGTWYYSSVDQGHCVDGPRLVESDEALEQILADANLVDGSPRSAPTTNLPQPSETDSAASEASDRSGSAGELLLSTDSTALRWGAQLGRPKARFLGLLAYEQKSVRQIRDLEPLYLREPHITRPKA
jgi:tRNA threonylcarbamoyladenosine biosynthesis protein TsaB